MSPRAAGCEPQAQQLIQVFATASRYVWRRLVAADDMFLIAAGDGQGRRLARLGTFSHAAATVALPVWMGPRAAAVTRGLLMQKGVCSEAAQRDVVMGARPTVVVSLRLDGPPRWRALRTAARTAHQAVLTPAGAAVGAVTAAPGAGMLAAPSTADGQGPGGGGPGLCGPILAFCCPTGRCPPVRRSIAWLFDEQGALRGAKQVHCSACGRHARIIYYRCTTCGEKLGACPMAGRHLPEPAIGAMPCTEGAVGGGRIPAQPQRNPCAAQEQPPSPPWSPPCFADCPHHAPGVPQLWPSAAPVRLPARRFRASVRGAPPGGPF